MQTKRMSLLLASQIWHCAIKLKRAMPSAISSPERENENQNMDKVAPVSRNIRADSFCIFFKFRTILRIEEKEVTHTVISLSLAVNCCYLVVYTYSAGK